MFWRRRYKGSVAAGVAETPAGTSVVVIDGANALRPRVINCRHFKRSNDLETASKEFALLKLPCVDSLPLGGYSILPVDVADVAAEERREAARWQVREVIDYPAEEAVIDLIDIPLVGDDSRVKYYAVVASRNTLRERIAQVDRLGSRLQAIDVTEFSLRNLLEYHRDELRGLCFLWIQEDRSLLLITREDRVYFSRQINLGLHQLGHQEPSDTDPLISEELQGHLDTIVLEIQRSIDYCESTFRLPQASQILVAFCGPENALVLDYLNRYLAAEVQAADFSQMFDFAHEVEQAELNICLPALGAALRAGRCV